MRRKIKMFLKMLILPFFCFTSFCNNGQKHTVENEVTIRSVYDHKSETSIIKKNQSTLFVINPAFDATIPSETTLMFLLIFKRSKRLNNEEAVVERFADKKMKKLINSYDYNYFTLTKNEILWLTYIEIECKKDEPIYLNVRGKHYLGGDTDDVCDTYDCYFAVTESKSTYIKDMIKTSWLIVP